MVETVQTPPIQQPTPPVTPQPNTVQKFPDPLDQLQSETSVGQDDSSKKELKVVNKSFWRTIIILLILLPILTGIGIFAYQFYLDYTLRKEAEHRPAPVINKDLVVTPDPLPSASSSATLLPGWKKYVDFKTQFGFAYPGEWFVVQDDSGQITIQNVDPQTAPEQQFDAVKDLGKQQIIITPRTSVQKFTQISQLESFLQNFDAEQTPKVNVLSSAAFTSDSGLIGIKRTVTQTTRVQFAQAFISIDQAVLIVTQRGDATVQPEVFDQILKSIAVISADQSQGDQTWTEYENAAGYSLRYPDSLALTFIPTTDQLNAVQVQIKPSGAEAGKNVLLTELFETEPPQTATQSATRDFNTIEFKVLEGENLIRYFGQLPSGKWLQVSLTYDSNLEVRKLLNQVIDTIELEKPTQLP